MGMFYNRENEEKLTQLAEKDEIYRAWKSGFEACAAPFEEYVNTQPEEIRMILWGYAEAGRMMQQRKVNLACSHMEFPGDEDHSGNP